IMRSHRWIVALAVVLSTTGVASPAAAEAQQCVVSGTSAAGLDRGTRDADGMYPYQSWLVSDAGQAVSRTLVQTQSSVMGIADNAGMAAKLQRGLIGYTADYATHTMVAVVTPEYANTAGLSTALTTARNTVAQAQPGAPGVRVQAGCFSAA